MDFSVSHRDGAARRGRLQLARGPVDTPAFMPVGTAGTVKGMTPDRLAQLRVGLLLGNTFHLLLRPGTDIVARHGGLHEFMGWPGPILTDSGGFQVFSLQKLNRVSEEGVVFSSPVNGDRIFLSPEVSMSAQRALGSDIVMIFDECTPYTSARARVAASMELSLRWARRSRDAHGDSPAALFGITQGGMHLDLRLRSLEGLLAIGFDGYAIGGLSVGESRTEMNQVVEQLAPRLPADKPRYLMGVGTPLNLLESVQRGIDLFDCVLPTRNGRNGHLFTSGGVLRIRNSRHRDSLLPPDPGCTCYTCTHFTRAYLHHLNRCGELLAGELASLHNLHYYLRLMEGMREAIELGRLADYAAACRTGWQAEEIPAQ